MEKPKRSSFPSGRQGSTKYAAAMKAWRAKQPKRWRPLSALDKDTTAWEKERKSRNPEKRITVGTGRSKKTKIVPNPNYKRPTKGQKGYSPDATSNPRKEVDMEAIRKIVKNLSNKKDKNSNWTNKVSGNGGSSKNTGTKVTNEKKVVKKDEPKSLRSGVFTKDPKTGKALGVMTRNQRAAWDKKNQTYLQEQLKKKNFRDYGKHGKRYG